MIKDSPKVIFNCKYTYGFNNIDRRKVNQEKVINKINGMFDYYSNEEKRAMSMFDYYTGKLTKDKTMNLVLENGKYATKEDIALRKKQYSKYIQNSNLWQGVISFNNDYLNQNITIEKLEQTLIKNVIPKFFKKCGFVDSKNMSYQIALHTDTDNLHFHFSFIEKKPNYKYGKEMKYRRKGKLTSKEINSMKNQIVHEIEKEKIYTPLLKQTNLENEELKKYFNPKERNYLLRDKKDLILEENILRLGKLLYIKRQGSEGRIKYNSINDKEIINLTRTIKGYLFSNKNKEFKNEYQKFKESLNDINNYFYRINKDNGVRKIILDKSLTDGKKDYVDNYVFNAIVNHANYIFNNEIKKDYKIKEKDIIEEILLKEYLKNKKQSRFNILKNYLSSNSKPIQFKNKYKVEQAIKSINSELEEAQTEFSKLFINNNYEK